MHPRQVQRLDVRLLGGHAGVADSGHRVQLPVGDAVLQDKKVSKKEIKRQLH